MAPDRLFALLLAALLAVSFAELCLGPQRYSLPQLWGALLLDEPMTYLDEAAQFCFLALLRSLAEQGKTILLVLHDLAQALQYCDAVAVLHKGWLAAFDAPAAIYAQKILEPIFNIVLCRAEDGTYYIKPPSASFKG